MFDAIFTEKNNGDKSTFEIFYLHLEFYCVRKHLQSVCMVKKCFKKGTLSFQQKRNKKMSHFDFKPIFASPGYHVFIETAWSDAKVNDKVKIDIETNQSSITIDPYACAVKEKQKHFDGWKTVVHVPREISMYIYLFIQKESGRISFSGKSLNYKPFSIPSKDLELPLLLTFSCPEKWVRNKMKDFIDDFCRYDFTGIIHNDDS